MELNRILVAVDSPNGRDAAFDRALALARSSGAELYVLHAVPANQPFSFHAPERLKRMVDMRNRAEDAGVRVQTVEQHGDPAAIIALHADARAVDLIVIGGEARRRGRRRSVVAEKIVRRANVPTLVVASDGPGSLRAFRRVLVAVDLSPDSLNVLGGAMSLTAPEPAQLTVMHSAAIEADDAVQSRARWMVPEFRAHVLEDARQKLQALVTDVPAGVDTRVQVTAGPAARTILEHAAEVGADLVVVGRSRGFTLLGSTALRVLRKNDRALLVVPTAAHRTARRARPRAA
jgi:nucleotide-binding universal stress UspA family protein